MEANNPRLETNSIHVNRQKLNYTEERVIRWLDEERYCRTQYDNILDQVLCMDPWGDNYSHLDYFERRRADLLRKNFEVACITMETLIQWFATRCGLSFVKELIKVVEDAIPEENRRRHALYNSRLKKPLCTITRTMDASKNEW